MQVAAGRAANSVRLPGLNQSVGFQAALSGRVAVVP